jgi:hypothetical protein
MRDVTVRLRRKARIVTDELRWRTGRMPRWTRNPLGCSCRLLPSGRFLLTREQRERAVRLLLEQRPSVVGATVAAADRVVSGQHYVWGRPVQGPVSWRNGLLLRGWPETAFWRLPLEGPEAPGDVKLAWEPSRHVQFLLLGRAYSLTRDSRFAASWVQQLGDWIAENPPWVGVQWASPLELAFRVIMWSWSSAHFLDAPDVDGRFWKLTTAGLAAHLHHIACHLSPRRDRPSNHRLGEAAGMIVGSISLPSHTRADAWYRTGIHTFLESLKDGLDGGVIWRENATSYHFFALELAVVVWALLTAHGRAVPPSLPSSVSRLLEGAALLMPGPRSHLRWGDDDDYRLCDPLHEPAERGAWAVDAASRMTGVPSPWPARDWHPTLAWVLGPELPMHRSRAHAPGLRVHRDLARWDGPRGTAYVLGCDRSAPTLPGHAHADLLGLFLFSGDEALVLDPGTFTYGGEEHWRRWFRSTGAHATVLVDGASQVRPGNRFGWLDDASGRWEQCAEAFGLSLVVGRHDAYARLGAMHRRMVLFSPGGTVFVRDVLCGAGTHSVSQRFLLPAGVTLEGDGMCAIARTRQGRLRIHATGEPAWNTRTEGEEGWCSPAYGLKEPAALVCRDSEAQLPTLLDVVLELGDRDIRPVKGGILLTGSGQQELLAVSDGGNGGIKVELPPPVGTVRSDAAALHLVFTENGAPLAARIIRGRTLELPSGVLLASAKRLQGVMVTWDQVGAQVSSLEPWADLSVAPRPGRLGAAARARPRGSHFTSHVVSA